MPLIKELYKMFSGWHNPPGKPKLMSKDEFTDIFFNS